MIAPEFEFQAAAMCRRCANHSGSCLEVRLAMMLLDNLMSGRCTAQRVVEGFALLVDDLVTLSEPWFLNPTESGY